jgi:hypothetical protein
MGPCQEKRESVGVNSSLAYVLSTTVQALPLQPSSVHLTGSRFGLSLAVSQSYEPTLT